VGLFIIAGGLELFSAERLITASAALISCLAVNVYIVGLNQLADIEIDRINKPGLPLASGALSDKQGRWIVGLAGLVALILSATQGIFLFSTVIISFIVGTVYSIPPLHLTRFPVAAALCIAFVRGFVSNIGLFLHYWQTFGSGGPALDIPWPFVVAVSMFFFGFGLVIALYKDIPDLAGDKRYGIRTFTVRLGPARVFGIGRWLLTLFYVVPIGLALLEIGRPANIAIIVAHFLALLFFWQKSLAVRPEDGLSMTRFYLILWGLFYAEYIILSLRQIVA
jgi:homogentisate phytyltransferase/homogentisate geranylgeranyltransferase